MNDDDDHLLNSITTEEDLFADEDLFDMTEPFYDEEEVPTETIMKRRDTPYKHRVSTQNVCVGKLSLF